MNDQPAHTAASSHAVPDEQRKTDYEAAIGPNLGYYLKHFESLDAGGPRAGWHWPAFFVTSYWFIYRQMWLPGLLSFFWPVISLIASTIFMSVLGKTTGVILCLLFLVAPTILLPIFANAIYWHHVHRRIAHLRPDIAASPEQRQARLKRDGGTSAAAVVGIAVGGVVVIGGILAAIAIPAYQDYTIRAQVFEGLNLASGVKARVAEFREQNGRWPDQADLDAQMPHGKYVESVGVAAGSVVIHYGNEANKNIAGLRVVLSPGMTPVGDIVWFCGNAPAPAGVNPAGGPAGSDISNRYLPVVCRGE